VGKGGGGGGDQWVKMVGNHRKTGAGPVPGAHRKCVTILLSQLSIRDNDTGGGGGGGGVGTELVQTGKEDRQSL